MGGFLRIMAIGAVFMGTTIGWMVLGGVTASRKGEQSDRLRSSVQNLWGTQQTQKAPELTFIWKTQAQHVRTETENGVSKSVSEVVTEEHRQPMPVASTAANVALDSDLRRKGLMWYSLYDVHFDAAYSYVHEAAEDGYLVVRFAFPDRGAIYDRFRFVVDGVDHAGQLDADGSAVSAAIPIKHGQRVAIQASYASRGLEQWRYAPTEGVGRLKDFSLRMRTNFADIDFPAQTLSPSSRVRRGQGWQLEWKFEQIVSGFSIGMITPTRIQPGELASALSFSAPISLLFFFGVIFVLATLRRIDLHPINYALISGAFFAFHLLFAYLVDQIPVEWAFAICSLVSVTLVTTYMRLVVSDRFAFREAAAAQLVYLVGFSLAHFWDGFTGLTVTILAILTLFLLMQLTGRIRWSETLTAPGTRNPGAAV